MEQLLRKIETLSPEELKEVQEAVRQLSEEALEDEVDRLLMEDGIPVSVPEPLTEEEIQRSEMYVPIAIPGEPVSETIIRERR